MDQLEPANGGQLSSAGAEWRPPENTTFGGSVGWSAAGLSARLPLCFHLAFKMAEISLVPLVEYENVWDVFLQTLLRIAVVLLDAELNDFSFTDAQGAHFTYPPVKL